MKSLRIIFILSLALVSTVLLLDAQSRSASARGYNQRASRIVGTVLDRNAARIAGATIKIENARLSRVVLSGDEGSFEVELPAGMYRLTVEMEGFKKFVLSPFRVRGGRRELVSVQMEVKHPASTLKIE